MIRIGMAIITTFLVAFPAVIFSAKAGSKSPSLASAALSPDQAVLHKAGVRPLKTGETGLQAWTGHRDGYYRPGEKLTLYVRSDRDAWITVLDTGTSGKTHVIFPNDYEPDHFLPAFTTLQIPGAGKKYHIGVGGPAGAELLKVFASATKKPLFPLSILKKAGPYRYIAASSKDIAGALFQKMTARSKSPSLSAPLQDRPGLSSQGAGVRTGGPAIYNSVDVVIQIVDTNR